MYRAQLLFKIGRFFIVPCLTLGQNPETPIMDIVSKIYDTGMYRRILFHSRNFEVQLTLNFFASKYPKSSSRLAAFFSRVSKPLASRLIHLKLSVGHVGQNLSLFN